MSKRTQQVAALVHKELAEMLIKLELPFTTITKVEVTPDLKWSKVGLSVLEGEKAEKNVMAQLKEIIYELQGELNRKIQIKNVPRISFFIDKSGEYASHISELIKKTHNE